MYLRIIDNTNVKIVKLIFSKKNISFSLGSSFKGVIYQSNNNKLPMGTLVNVLILTNNKKKNSYLQYDNSTGILVEKDLSPLGSRILDIVDINIVNKKVNFINFSNLL